MINYVEFPNFFTDNLYTGRGNAVVYDRPCDYLTVFAVVEIVVIVVVLLTTAPKTFITAEGAQPGRQGMENGKKSTSALWTEIKARSGVTRACENKGGRPASESPPHANYRRDDKPNVTV